MCQFLSWFPHKSLWSGGWKWFFCLIMGTMRWWCFHGSRGWEEQTSHACTMGPGQKVSMTFWSQVRICSVCVLCTLLWFMMFFLSLCRIWDVLGDCVCVSYLYSVLSVFLNYASTRLVYSSLCFSFKSGSETRIFVLFCSYFYLAVISTDLQGLMSLKSESRTRTQIW